MGNNVKHAALLAAIVMVAFAAMPVFANSSAAPGLARSLAQVQCRADFTTGVVGSIVAAVPNTTSALSPFPAKLASDITTLTGYATSGDKDNYRTALASFDSDLKDVRTAIISARLDNRKDFTATIRSSLQSQYAQLKSTLDSCETATLTSFANERITQYQADIANYTSKANALKAKGLDISGITSVLTDASSFVSSYQSAVTAANGTQALRDAITSHCLYDGCNTGENFHLAAKFEIAKMNSLMSFVKAMPASANYTSQLSAAQGYIDTAQSTLTTVGTSKYQQGQSKTIFDNISSAYKAIRDVINAMKKKA